MIIRFDRRQHGDHGLTMIVPHIDGTPLTDLIDTYEIAAGMKPAGGAYDGLIPAHFRFGPITDHFHGRQGPKTPVLGCECGEWGCWPLLTTITVTDDHVIWDAFEQPHRTTRDYSGFGPLQFDRRQYDRALHDLATAISPTADRARPPSTAYPARTPKPPHT